MMKKNLKKGVLIAAGVAAGIALCKKIKKETKNLKRHPRSAEEFKTAAIQKGYKITKLESPDKNITESFVAANETGEFKIFYKVFADSETAKEFFKRSTVNFEKQAESMSEYNGFTFNSLKVNNKGIYKCVSRIENTCIDFNMDSKYRNNADELLGELGY